MKRYIYLVILSVAALAAILYVWIMRTGPEPAPSSTQLVSALTHTSVTPKEGVLEARMPIPKDLITQEYKQELLSLGKALLAWDENTVVLITHGTEGMEDYANSLKPSTAVDTHKEHSSSSLNTVTGYVLSEPTGQVQLELILTKRIDETNHLLAKATFKDITQLPRLEHHWQQVFSAYGYAPDYSTLLVGTLDGDKTYNESQLLLQHIFQALRVEKPMKTADGNLISWAGHSPRIPNVIRDVQGEPINIQAAIRYHYLDDRTHIYLGSPLIYRDY